MNNLLGAAGVCAKAGTALVCRPSMQSIADKLRNFDKKRFMSCTPETEPYYCTAVGCTVDGSDAPLEFVSVTVTLLTSVASPSIVKLCVYMQLVPYWSDVPEPYHPWKRLVSCTVTFEVLIDLPETGVNWKVALVMSRVEEIRGITMDRVCPDGVSVGLDKTGGAGGTVTVIGARLAGVMSWPPASVR
jgi:hypothetical protein